MRSGRGSFQNSEQSLPIIDRSHHVRFCQKPSLTSKAFYTLQCTRILAGSRVFSYVWPTSLDPAEVGFDAKAGILAFAVTAHPDFDDTPLFDENGNGKPNDDGNLWHSHWVVLTQDEACGPKGMKVKDIPAGSKPRLPKTWPGLPILLDSPGYSPTLDKKTVSVRVPLENIEATKDLKYDGVTAGLRVNASVHAPLLCIETIFKVASGDLSLPGTVGKTVP